MVETAAYIQLFEPVLVLNVLATFFQKRFLRKSFNWFVVFNFEDKKVSLSYVIYF